MLGFLVVAVVLSWVFDAATRLGGVLGAASGVVGDVVIAFGLVWIPIAVIDARRCTRETALRAQLQANLEAKLETQQEEREQAATISSRIRAVLDGGGPRIVYQPIVEMESRGVVGYEALSRFPGSEPPDRWFEEATRVGLGRDLEARALRKAVSGLERLPEGAALSVNASPDLLADPDVVAVLRGKWAQRLVVELTEHVVVDNYYRFRETVEQVRRWGVRLAVDDAGAGYASFRHIVDLSPDIIKVDGSLVRGVESDPARRSLIGAFVAFAGDIGATLVAECVETEDEAAELRRWGIRYAQGWLYGKPGPLETITTAPASLAISGGRETGR